jgi:hypothetical protein
VILNTICGWKNLDKLAVSKQTTHRLDMKRLNTKKLNELEGEESTIRENTKISATYSLGYNELKKHKP